MPRLVIFDNQVRGIDLPDRPVVIGRSKRSDIPISDGLLSRKHCAIVPEGSAFRLVDLKSANGTFLNGVKVKERAQLNYDDIIEIGQTVMVFLDTGVWSRGEALVRLRNPIKAQELIHRLKALQPVEKSRASGKAKIPRSTLPAAAGTLPAADRRRSEKARRLTALLKELPETLETDEKLRSNLVELLVEYAVYKTVSFLVRRQPQIKRVLARTVAKAVEGALLSGQKGHSGQNGSLEEWRAHLRADLESALKEAVAPSSKKKREP